MTVSVEPLSNAAQVGLRIPIILIALAGAVIALILIRRLGVAASILAAAGSLFVALDQIVNIAWVLHTNDLIKKSDPDIDHINAVTKLYTFADVALITIGVALFVAALVARRSVSTTAAVPMAGPVAAPGPAYPAPPGMYPQQ